MPGCIFQRYVAAGAPRAAGTAPAQRAGGVLRVYHRDSPASMSIHEEGTVGVIMPMMGVMNNLILYDQHIARNEASTIRP